MRIEDFLARLVWLDGAPLLPRIQPYRLRLFEEFFAVGDDGVFLRNLGLFGRSKKNDKTSDLVHASLFALVGDSPAGHDSECYILANDGDQARDDLSLAKKMVKANPDVLGQWLKVKANSIERKDGRGFLEVLPAGDVVGQHGKSYRFVGYDEIHGYRTWDVLEAMQPDPNRRDAQQWITSYASLFHRPGVPLFDLFTQAKAGADPRMLFSWYAADFTTDPDFADLAPERRANPSMAAWADAGYLAQQQRRLPSHKYRRLHLNLPGLPEGSAFSAESVMDAIDRGVQVRLREADTQYVAFVDMSGGSRDDASLGIAHRDRDGRAVVDRIVDQGQRPPFDPRLAVGRFVAVLTDYGVSAVTGDSYAGETFKADFERMGITYHVSGKTKSELYESLEPRLNSHQVILPDAPVVEQQLLGLVWRGGKIDHQSGEHDDLANAAAGVVDVALSESKRLVVAGVWGGARATREQRERRVIGCVAGTRDTPPRLIYEDETTPISFH
ncbi:MAG: hypothetical protein Q8T13_19880 [Acidobacteriota bacterium]|nr:hypothetical protein [Acidobacteriota bacterium]